MDGSIPLYTYSMNHENDITTKQVYSNATVAKYLGCKFCLSFNHFSILHFHTFAQDIRNWTKVNILFFFKLLHCVSGYPNVDK